MKSSLACGVSSHALPPLKVCQHIAIDQRMRAMQRLQINEGDVRSIHQCLVVINRRECDEPILPYRAAFDPLRTRTGDLEARNRVTVAVLTRCLDFVGGRCSIRCGTSTRLQCHKISTSGVIQDR